MSRRRRRRPGWVLRQPVFSRARAIATLVLERERFPRFHIGESRVAVDERWRALDRIGVRDAVAATGFVERVRSEPPPLTRLASQYA